MLKNIMTRQGHWLFRWGPFLPLLALPLAVQAFESSGWMTKEFGISGERAWDLFCVLVALSGLAIRVFAVGFAPCAFGRSSGSQKAPTLDSTGLYSVLRHPLYVGNFFIFVGCVLLLKSDLFFLFAVALYLAYYERIVLAEEEVLAERYGADFDIWASRTPLIIPKIANWMPPTAPFSWRIVVKREFRTLFLIAAVFFVSEALESVVLEGTTFKEWLADEPHWAWFAGLSGLLYIPAIIAANASIGLHAPGAPPARADFEARESRRNKAAYSARVRYGEQVSERYQWRNPHRHRAEMQLLARTFADVPHGTVLDIPSGGGRVGVFLAQRGYQVTCADYSQAMVDIARRNADEVALGIAVDRQDIEAMTYADKAYDVVVCFRLFHHFPDRATRARAVREMCRVAGDRVVLSYFSPFAFSALERKIHGLIKGGQNKFATSLGEVRGYFEACGFKLEQDFGQIPLLQTLHIAVFRRVRSAND